MNSLARKASLVFLCLLLFGCSDSPDNVEEPSGIWEGIYTTTGGYQFLSSALITSNGLVGIKIDNGNMFFGSTIGNDRLKIIGSDSLDPSYLVTMTVSASSSSRMRAKVVTGSYGMYVNDDFDFKYDLSYDRSASLTKLLGEWSNINYYFGSVGQDWKITINEDGTFSGTASIFSVNGSFMLIDPLKNEYGVMMTINNPQANYTLNGNYTGIGYLRDGVAANSKMRLFLVGDQQYKVMGVLELNRN